MNEIYVAASSGSFWGVIVSILTILGSLGIFLYGMKVMSEGIQKAAGSGMRRALATLTHNRISSVFTGFMTTTLVQSSSATTVMVVSFVNAGLLTLVESIGVIMGANLGTTITAWLVAYIGKFSIAKIALPIIGIGLPMFFIGKGRLKASGEGLIGFGLLFTGLAALKNSVPDLKGGVKENVELQETIANIIEMLNGYGFGSVVIFLIAGILLTLIVQSSSAAMAITITCAWNGWFGPDPYEAFKMCSAVVLGENIGTTVTAWLASIGANVHAKRAARAHFLFNVLGTAWALVAFYLLTKLVWGLVGYFPESLVEVKTAKGEAGNPLTIVAFALAVFHTLFNLLNILFLVWFVPQIANIVEKWVKVDSEDSEKPRLQYISQSLVDLGELNLVEAENALEKMADHCQVMFDGFIHVFENPDTDLSKEVTRIKEMEDETDVMVEQITNYLMRCSSRDVGEGNSAKITSMIRISAELEECADANYRLMKLLERKYQKKRDFSPERADAIREFAEIIKKLLNYVKKQTKDVNSTAYVGAVKELHGTSKALCKKMNKSALNRMKESDPKLEMLNIDINNQLRTIADHARHVTDNSDH